ncbi:NAD(P)/FAD-dependent oxidoreductase [Tsukamurella soli]|uniref:FAD-binding oxidoreductase n=1 Tax=Tsukamurella soli TaxID=644556 RepID=A0ABP8KE29_9ACTN
MRADVDVVIVGAGIVGAAAALELARSGRSVVVLERFEPIGAGSRATAGNLHIQGLHARRPGQDTPVDTARLLPMQRVASDLWNAWDATVPGLGLVRCGGYSVAETQEQAQLLTDKSIREADAGIPTTVLSGKAARARMPLLGPTVEAATWCEWDGFADPVAAGTALLDQATREGVELRAHRPVTGLEHDGSRWLVETETGATRAESVVLACGPWLADVAALAGVNLDLVPRSLQMHSFEAAPGTLTCLVQHVAEGMSLKQQADRLILGGGWPAGPYRAADGRAPVLASSTAGNHAQMTRLIPQLGSAPLTDVWTGPVVTTPDEMPVIGALPAAPRLFVAGGTYSFTFAPLWARTLTALIAGSPPPVDVSAFGPDRLTSISAEE